MKRTFYGYGAAIAAFAVLGCQVKSDGGPGGAATQRIEPQPTSTKVVTRDIVGYRLMGGVLNLPPNAQAEVYSSYAAPVELVRVKEGDRVNRGQTLVELATGQDANYEQAKGTYDAALAAYNQALAQYEQPVRDASRQLEQAKSTERTLRQSTVPGGDATELQAATRARQAAEDALKLAKAQADTNTVQYKQQLDQAKAALDQARAGVRQESVTSPIAGTVVKLNVASGQVLDSKTPVAHIVDLGALTIRAEALPDDAPYVKRGTSVVVLFNDYPDRKFSGKVRTVNTLPGANDGRPRLGVVIDFDNTDGMVRPNSSVRTVGVVVGRKEDVLAVPVDAVFQDASGKPTVRVLEKENWRPVVVEIGLSDGYFVEVSSGLAEGQTVQVVQGQGAWILGTPPA